MRIIAGKYRGRILKSPLNNRIRPTADRVKEAVFSSLESRVGLNSINFLDAFCGSGAMGLEAMSRGAETVYLMDIDTRLVRDNSSNFKSENIKMITGDVLNPPKASIAMDVIFIDPPYALEAGNKAMKSLINAGWANEDTLFVVETEKTDETIIEENFSFYSMKKYRNTMVYYLKM